MRGGSFVGMASSSTTATAAAAIIFARVLFLLSSTRAFAPSSPSPCCILPLASVHVHSRAKTTLPPTALFMKENIGGSNDDNEDDGKDEEYDFDGIGNFEQERMNIVRMLQRSYYSEDAADVFVSSDKLSNQDRNDNEDVGTSRLPHLDTATGKILNLPLWRVGWVETPGRRNCLNVHEMQYTHMFEKLLSSFSQDVPLYFGHLYLPGGSTSAKSGEERYRLKTWQEELLDDTRFSNYMKTSTRIAPEISTPTIDRSAVIGCLMQVLDYRRMQDGRLMILVQALERFVVEEVVDTLPYAVANVQILLDREELPWEKNTAAGARRNYDENVCKYQRRPSMYPYTITPTNSIDYDYLSQIQMKREMRSI